MLLVIDAYGCDRESLEAETICHEALRDAAARTGMTIIRDMGVITYRDPERPEDWGVTGTVWIAESHIAIHTWPERGYAHFVLDSCRDFDHGGMQAWFLKRFNAQRSEAQVLDVGLYSALRKQEAFAAAGGEWP